MWWTRQPNMIMFCDTGNTSSTNAVQHQYFDSYGVFGMCPADTIVVLDPALLSSSSSSLRLLKGRRRIGMLIRNYNQSIVYYL